MIRIFHLISCLDIGGAEVSLLRLLSALDRKRFQCVVVSLIKPGPIAAPIQNLGIEVLSLQMKRSAVSLDSMRRLVSHLRHERPDLLMTWLYHSDLMGLIAGKMAGVPSIIWNLRASNMDMSKYPRLSGATVRLCTRLSSFPTAVIANSESGKAFHAHIGYRPKQWAVIKNGVDHLRFQPDAELRQKMRLSLHLTPHDIAVGLVARLDPMKDHDNFLAAARIVAENNYRVHFVLAGRGVGYENHQLTSQISQPPLAGRVHLLGERTDIPHLMTAFDIACSSSRSEGFPNTIMEAMSCGVPCVATNVGDSADIVRNTGVVVPPADPVALSHGLLRLIEMEQSARQGLGCQARQHIIQNYGIDRFAREYDLFISALVDKRSRPHA